MSIQEAATELREHIGRPSWLVSIGIGLKDGQEAIVLYLSSNRPPDLEYLRDGWHGFPVTIKKFGSLSPIGS